MIKIAVVRGDFVSPWELQNFEKLPINYVVTVFTGYYPITKIEEGKRFSITKLISPVDLNFGKINRAKMAFLNRLFVDAHVLFGLEKRLEGVDVAHAAETYYSFTNQCLIAKNRKIVKKVVSTVWENIPFNNESIHGRREYKEQAFKQVDLFLAVTEKAKKTLMIEGCSPSKIEVLKPGLDLVKFCSKTKRLFRKNRLRLLFVGRLEKDKGIDLLLTIFSKMVKYIPFLELTIVGSGNKESEVIDAQKKIPQIRYLGNVSYKNMPDVYASSDILVHPAIGTETWQEQYGMVLVEAMASGLPILSFDKGSIAEVVGEGGVLTSPEKFEKELSQLINSENQRRLLSKKAVYLAKLNYDARKYSIRLGELYKEILNEKGIYNK